MTSIIIPTYNEAQSIALALKCLGHARGNFEVIVVDGASDDGTGARVQALLPGYPRPLRLLTAERNRARQLNRAAAVARGEVFLFLHADALLAPEAVEALEAGLEDERLVGGNFNLRYEGESLWSRFFTWANRARRRFGIYYGDSGIFVRREVFRRLGGFKPIPIMDDYEFVRRLERAGETACLEPVVTVSNRRWQEQGVLKTLCSWFLVQSLYSLGVSPEALAYLYQPVRARS